MNQKNFKSNITGTQKEDAPKSIIQQDRDKGLLSYKFEIKKVPAHLATVDNSKRKPKSTFVRRYINLENGFIYKLVDDKYVKVDPKTVSKSSQGDDEYEF